jgi:hypothetical protein
MARVVRVIKQFFCRPKHQRMRPPELASVDLKLARAQEHLDAIRSAEQQLRDGPDCRLEAEADPTRAGFENFILRLPDPGPRLSLLIGDCVHNARSALDHLVFALADATAPKSGVQRTDSEQRDSMFPICLCQSGNFSVFTKQVQRGRLNHIPPAAEAIIHGLQPTAANDSLWILNELENIDKHRRLALTTVTASNVDVDIPGHLHIVASNPLVPFRAGDVLFGASSAEHISPGAKAQMTIQAATFIAFQDLPATDLLVVGTLNNILSRIRDQVIPALEVFF